jgi:galactose-1-phosphate uridylyltransferase
MNSSNIKNLINYAYQHLNLNPTDELYVRNRLLEACFMEEYDEDTISNEELIDKSKPHTRLFIYELGFFVF